MTQLPTPESVIGAFDGTTERVDNLEVTFERRGDQFWLRMAEALDYEAPVVLTTGAHHMQLYWLPADVEQAERALEIAPFAYLTKDKRWVPLPSTFLRPPGEYPLRESGSWNRTCIACHTTHGIPNAEGVEFNTHVAEFGIACEACHGPGETHVRSHSSGEIVGPEAFLVNPRDLSHRRSSQVCGQCHMIHNMADEEWQEDRFFANGLRYRPGDDLSVTRKSYPYPYKDEDDGFFWPDGMVRVAGREYDSLQATTCFQQGELSCLSCHVMHKSPDDPRPLHEWANDQIGPEMESNQACLQCHTEFQQTENLSAHTHHVAGSSGSLCYNCHMPHTSYALLKAIRSHHIDSPDVKVSTEVGRPNACNLCHLDKTLDWSADHLNQWYDIARPAELSQQQRETSAALLWLLKGDAGQRALAAWHLGWQPAQQTSGDHWQAPFLAPLLEDPYDAVRYIARRSLRSLPGFEDFDYDFVGSPPHRSEARRQAINQWSEMPKTSHPSQSAILLDEDGRVRNEELLRLLKARSNLPVNLLE